jgi:hypothetical protein
VILAPITVVTTEFVHFFIMVNNCLAGVIFLVQHALSYPIYDTPRESVITA